MEWVAEALGVSVSVLVKIWELQAQNPGAEVILTEIPYAELGIETEDEAAELERLLREECRRSSE